MHPAAGRGWWIAVLLVVACDPAARAPALEIPPRSPDAPGGAEVTDAVRDLALGAREGRIYGEISRGNVPGWLRQLQPVEVTGDVGGRAHRVTFWVTPDYLSVGSDDDHLLVPLSPQTAQRIADRVGASLPTPRMVDAIWEAAHARLAPIRFIPDEHMGTLRYFERHQRLVRAQQSLRGMEPGVFAAGHKKDVVISAALSQNPGRVAIYGWHRTDGEPLQPLTTVLGRRAVYFNHGIRLVHRDVLVDGAPRDLAEVLRDPGLAPLLSDEGVIAEARYPLVPGEE